MSEQAIRQAAQALVDKLYEIHKDERFQRVWQVAQAHLGPYEGPQYGKELHALDKALVGRIKHRNIITDNLGILDAAPCPFDGKDIDLVRCPECDGTAEN